MATEIAIPISNELADLCIVIARIFESLPPRELMKMQSKLETPTTVRKNAATVATLSMSCGFLFAMQLREMQKAKLQAKT